VKILTLCFILSFSVVTQASRAIVKNYQSFYYSDSLTSYLLIPTLMDIGKDQVLIESGSSGATSTADGAAFFGHRAVSENWLVLVSVGAQNGLIASARSQFNTEFSKNFRLMQNPLNLFLGYKFFGQSVVLGFSRSEFKDKLSFEFEKSFVTTIGYRYGLFHLNLHVVNDDQVNNSVGDELGTEQALQIVGLYELDSAELAIKYDSFFQKQKNNFIENSSRDRQSFQISYFDMTKFQDIQFSYRFEYASQSIKDKISDEVNRINYFPITLGFQNQLADWLSLVGTIKQPLFVNQGTGILQLNNATTVYLGSEFNYKNAQINALLGGLSGGTANQNLDGNSLLSQVSLTYRY
jgi:hypothetical protein